MRIYWAFLIVFLLLMSGLSSFSLPSSDAAVLDHFLSMTPWGIWQNVVVDENSPIRQAYYLQTTRKGFATDSLMVVCYGVFLLGSVFLYKKNQ